MFFLFFRSVKAQENETNKKTPKKSSSRMKIGQVFKKTPTKDNGGNLFGVPLNRICDGENLPKPVMVSIYLQAYSVVYILNINCSENNKVQIDCCFIGLLTKRL